MDVGNRMPGLGKVLALLQAWQSGAHCPVGVNGLRFGLCLFEYSSKD